MSAHTSEICRTVTTSLHIFGAVNCQLFAAVQLLDKLSFVSLRCTSFYKNHNSATRKTLVIIRQIDVTELMGFTSVSLWAYNFERFVRVLGSRVRTSPPCFKNTLDESLNII